MKLLSLLFAVGFAARAAAQPPIAPPPDQPVTSSPQDSTSSRENSPDSTPSWELPVSLEKIKSALEQPTPLTSITTQEAKPTFKVQIQERQKIRDLLNSLDFKTTRAPAGGLYMAEMQRQWWPAVDNPSAQPLAAFSQGELVTILAETLAGTYFGKRALGSVSSAERAHALASAREEVRQAIAEYCAGQPSGGAGIQICSSSPAGR